MVKDLSKLKPVKREELFLQSPTYIATVFTRLSKLQPTRDSLMHGDYHLLPWDLLETGLKILLTEILTEPFLTASSESSLAFSTSIIEDLDPEKVSLT